MSLTIRLVTVDDAARVADICSVGWRQTVEGKMSKTFQQKTINHWYTIDKVTADIKQGSYTYVAELDGYVTGVIGGGMDGKFKGHVFVFYVDDKYRYKGIGKELLKKITARQKNKGATEQWVSVQEDNELGLPFYETQGFIVQYKRTVKSAGGEEQVSLKMRREI